MSHDNPVELISDDDDDDNLISYKTPINDPIKKRPRSNFAISNNNFPIINVDDDPTPLPKLHKSSSPSFIVPETPLSELTKSKGVFRGTAVVPDPTSSSGDSVPICVDSEDEGKKYLLKSNCGKNLGTYTGGKDVELSYVKEQQLEDRGIDEFDAEKWLDIDSTCYLHDTVQFNVRNKDGDVQKTSLLKDINVGEHDSKSVHPNIVKEIYRKDGRASAAVVVECLGDSPVVDRLTYSSADNVIPVDHGNEDFELEGGVMSIKSGAKVDVKKKDKGELAATRNKSKEEKTRLMEEKKLKREQEKLQKLALKAETLKQKQIEKEKRKLSKLKFSEKDIVAEIDNKAIQLGKIGGHILTSLGEKGLQYVVTPNAIEKSIVWRLTAPEGVSQLSSVKTEVPYILLIYEAEEFCKLINDGCLLDQLYSVQTQYPAYKICCLTNRLMAYVYKREQERYRNNQKESGWKRPPVEEVIAKLTTQFSNLHSRHCVDEAEVAEHVVRLTCNLAKCHSRKKLSNLTVIANGAHIPKDFIDRNLILKSTWLKALCAIPKVQPRFAMAIGKKYPTMRSLLSVYLDEDKSVHEKEFLLSELPVEDVYGSARVLGDVCSKRVYRILMAQNGSIRTADVETGADFFTQQG